MAFLKFRGSNASPSAPSATTADNTPLSNDDIDGNFQSLNVAKLENGLQNAYNPGSLLVANSDGVLTAIPPGMPGSVLHMYTPTQVGWGWALQTIDETAADDTYYPTLSPYTSNSVVGLQQVYTSSTKLTFNPSSGTLGATHFDSLSDARYKSDLVKIEDAMSKIRQLTGYLFTITETGKRSSGLLAQDVLKIQPESVGGNAERLLLSYDSLFGLVVEALKEVDDKLTDIQNQLSNK